MKANLSVAQKPKALRRGSRFSVFAPASPADALDSAPGIAELERLGFVFSARTGEPDPAPEGYFASSAKRRLQEFLQLAQDPLSAAMIALRGGYGANYLLSVDLETQLPQEGSPKCLLGFSDLTSLQIYLWQRLRWVTFYGPMITAGFRQGAGAAKGYDKHSFLQAVSNSSGGWAVRLQAETLCAGEGQSGRQSVAPTAAEGMVLGGCLTLLEATLGTPWELDVRDSILVLEDTGMKPYQVDRALMHLWQAGKFEGVRGMVLGDFPGGAPAVPGSPTIREVCARILAPLHIPIVYGAPIGHTERPLLTLPLGIRARLLSSGEGTLEFLEPAVIE